MGLIVTGAEPIAATLPEEPFWNDLTEVIDWAKTNTRSTIWSCLAAHAAVLHLDGIERQRLDAKCSGIFDCVRVSDNWLTQGIRLAAQDLAFAHQRVAQRGPARTRLSAADAIRADAGVDIFAKQLRSHFVFFQGHPEYDALSLQREYLRDITRYLARERDIFPAFPTSYFDAETERKLANFRSGRSRSARFRSASNFRTSHFAPISQPASPPQRSSETGSNICPMTSGSRPGLLDFRLNDALV